MKLNTFVLTFWHLWAISAFALLSWGKLKYLLAESWGKIFFTRPFSPFSKLFFSSSHISWPVRHLWFIPVQVFDFVFISYCRTPPPPPWYLYSMSNGMLTPPTPEFPLHDLQCVPEWDSHHWLTMIDDCKSTILTLRHSVPEKIGLGLWSVTHISDYFL